MMNETTSDILAEVHVYSAKNGMQWLTPEEGAEGLALVDVMLAFGPPPRFGRGEAPVHGIYIADGKAHCYRVWLATGDNLHPEIGGFDDFGRSATYTLFVTFPVEQLQYVDLDGLWKHPFFNDAHRDWERTSCDLPVRLREMPASDCLMERLPSDENVLEPCDTWLPSLSCLTEDVTCLIRFPEDGRASVRFELCGAAVNRVAAGELVLMQLVFGGIVSRIDEDLYLFCNGWKSILSEALYSCWEDVADYVVDCIREAERLEKERLEEERLKKERLEKERLKKERLEEERLKKERLEKERLEKERHEAGVLITNPQQGGAREGTLAPVSDAVVSCGSVNAVLLGRSCSESRRLVDALKQWLETGIVDDDGKTFSVSKYPDSAGVPVDSEALTDGDSFNVVGRMTTDTVSVQACGKALKINLTFSNERLTDIIGSDLPEKWTSESVVSEAEHLRLQTEDADVIFLLLDYGYLREIAELHRMGCRTVQKSKRLSDGLKMLQGLQWEIPQFIRKTENLARHPSVILLLMGCSQSLLGENGEAMLAEVAPILAGCLKNFGHCRIVPVSTFKSSFESVSENRRADEMQQLSCFILNKSEWQKDVCRYLKDLSDRIRTLEVENIREPGAGFSVELLKEAESALACLRFCPQQIREEFRAEFSRLKKSAGVGPGRFIVAPCNNGEMLTGRSRANFWNVKFFFTEDGELSAINKLICIALIALLIVIVIISISIIWIYMNPVFDLIWEIIHSSR